jgi:DNA recombination protein Rad52
MGGGRAPFHTGLLQEQAPHSPKSPSHDHPITRAMDLSSYASTTTTTNSPTTPGPGAHLVHPAGQLGGADPPQEQPPAIAPSHLLQRAALLAVDRTPRSGSRCQAHLTVRPAEPLPSLHPASLTHTSPIAAMTCTFSAEQITALSAPLDRAKVRQREQGRSQVSYLEGWQVIAEANRIFGFDGWQRETVALRCVNQSERSIGREQRPGWGVTYTARVRITVGESTAGSQLIREGCGAGHGIDTDLGQAHESALKEAETDAMKRALMTFGNAFGLALYDKQQREVTGGALVGVIAPAPSRPAGRVHATAGGASSANSSHSQAPRIEHQAQAAATPKTEPPSALPTAAAQPPADDPGLAPLDQATIRQLHATIRALPAPVLEGFSKAFRKRFQVPADAPSIADRICQRRHHDWIETFLVSHR